MTIETTTDRLELEEEQRPMRPAGVPSGEAIGKPGILQTLFLMRLKSGTVVELRASGELASDQAKAIKDLLRPANYSDADPRPKSRPDAIIRIFELSLYSAGLNS